MVLGDLDLHLLANCRLWDRPPINRRRCSDLERTCPRGRLIVSPPLHFGRHSRERRARSRSHRGPFNGG